MIIDDIAPTRLPNCVNYIEDAFLLGFKGQKHALKYPIKKGYIADKYGLSWNL